MPDKRMAQGALGERVAANIRQVREWRGESYNRLSILTGLAGHLIPPMALSRIERCMRRCDIDDLDVLSRCLNVSIADLLAPQEAVAVAVARSFPAGLLE